MENPSHPVTKNLDGISSIFMLKILEGYSFQFNKENLEGESFHYKNKLLEGITFFVCVEQDIWILFLKYVCYV